MVENFNEIKVFPTKLFTLIVSAMKPTVNLLNFCLLSFHACICLIICYSFLHQTFALYCIAIVSLQRIFSHILSYVPNY